MTDQSQSQGVCILGYVREPELHSGVIDYLDEADARAHSSIYCSDCREMVHAVNNECMREWFDTGRGPLCWDCLRVAIDADDPNLGLPDGRQRRPWWRRRR